ncbi:RNA/RNP complex-1-interacting phosphatase [Neopsephotus bourkii]|uniref:RNA/RNP complex-1-interacting phosphatase n=1 Tax=Neopsephotus bourkii TaxID=309878 RepID=UPI002AA54578|nr:RNA/RNP complex-1-interacting phosphatase [Neopsephotus bourkii]
MVGRGASRIPDRWTDYIPLGRRIPGTRFIAFKVPLRKSFDQNLHPEERFSPHDLIKKIKEQKEELGLIIDLTYTTRYYKPEELPASVFYSKILTMGHQIPNRHTVSQFKYVVKQFLRDNRNNNKLIGVHCTHGLNRTGYLVCRYLIDVEGMEANTAIELFNRARGHPIERINYIRHLQQRPVKKNWGLNGLDSDCFRQKAAPTPISNNQMIKHHSHHSDQFPIAVPRKSGSSKKRHRRGATAQTPYQVPAHELRAMDPRQPHRLAVRNCQLLLPTKEQSNGLFFPPQNPQFCPAQGMQPARRRRHHHRKPVGPA